MTAYIHLHQKPKAASFTQLPNFLFEAPGWADEYGRIYLYYPINEVTALLHCGRQKAVDTLRELQYAGLVEIRKQGCGKPNRIYPKSYEAVPNTDFKKSGCGTPEG